MSSLMDPVVPPHSHSISFFQDEQQLCTTVAKFIAEGLQAGEPGLIVTNKAHRDGIAAELSARQIDVQATIATGDLLLCDAEETLATIMTAGIPESALYHENVGKVVVQLLKGRPGPVRIFGDMVDLLWQRGEYDAAIRIEMLSNQLAVIQPISVICGYSMGHFLKTAAKLETVKALHGHQREPAAMADDRPGRSGSGPATRPRRPRHQQNGG